MPAAMPCKISGRTYKEICRIPDAPKTKYACIVEAGESTRKRLERTLHTDHEDHIAGKGINSLSHYNLLPRRVSAVYFTLADDEEMLAARERPAPV